MMSVKKRRSIINKKFIKKAILERKMKVYYKKDALLVIEQCKDFELKVYGVDSFRVYGKKIQPFSKYCSDYSEIEPKEKTWELAKEHILYVSQIDNQFVYEIVY